MSFPRLRAIALAAAATLGLGACSYGGYGSGIGVSVGYGSGFGYGSSYCDPYWDDCYYDRYSRRGSFDPWYGWYNGFYYPGIGTYVYDRFGRPRLWDDGYRSYWEGRRRFWGHRNWNDRRWERWDGYRGDHRRMRRHRRGW